jgi:hypothetical protein
MVANSELAIRPMSSQIPTSSVLQLAPRVRRTGKAINTARTVNTPGTLPQPYKINHCCKKRDTNLSGNRQRDHQVFWSKSEALRFGDCVNPAKQLLNVRNPVGNRTTNQRKP